MKEAPKLPFINSDYDGRQMYADLTSVPDEAALSTAKFFEDAAENLRKRHEIWQYYQSVTRKAKSDRSALKRLPGRILETMLNGLSFETAARELADKQGVPIESVYSHWLNAVKELEAKAKALRNVQIIRLYEANYCDTDIADMVSISDRQVRRIVRDYLQKKRANAG